MSVVADLIVQGRILTGEPSKPIVEAVAVRGGRIVFWGGLG